MYSGKKKVEKVVLFLLVMMLFVSCYEREEACLDLLSTNYSLTADVSCEECCEYPGIQLRFTHSIGEDAFRSDSVLVNDLGQEYSVRNVQMIFSNFDLKFQDGREEKVREMSVFEDVDGEEVELRQDQVIITPSNSFTEVGTMREVGVVEEMGFNIGVDHKYISVEDENPLFSADSLYTSENGYYDISMYIKTGESLEINKTIRFFLNIENSRTILSPVDVSKVERIDFGLKVSIDYEKLLKEIDILEDSSEQIITDYIIPNKLITLLQ